MDLSGVARPRCIQKSSGARHLAWFLQNGLIERGARTPAAGVRDAVLAAVEGGALAASAVRDAARKIRSLLGEQARRRGAPLAVPTAGEPLDVAWGSEPRWRLHAEPRVTVRPQPRGAPPRVSAPVLVSATAYPLT